MRFWVLLFWFGISIFSLPTTALELTDSEIKRPEESFLWRKLSLITAPKSFALLKQAIEHSKPVETTLGQDGAFGLKLKLSNKLTQNGIWFVQLHANYLDVGQAYWQSADGQIFKLPTFGQLNGNSIRMLHSQSFQLALNAQESGYLWLYIDAKKFPVAVQPSIIPDQLFYPKLFQNNAASLMAISVMLTLATIALFAFIRTGQMVTLACAGYVGLHGLGWLAASGGLGHFFLHGYFNPVYLGMLLFPFAIAAASQFTKLLFYCQLQHVGLARLFNTMSVICVVLGTGMLFLPFSSSYFIAHIIGIVWVPVAIYTGIVMLNENDFRAKYYLVGNLFYGVALLFFIVVHVTDINYTGSSEFLVIAALAIDCFCILLSLSEWLQLQQKEYKRSYVMSRVDTLTQIGNRYAFNEDVQQLQGQPYCIVFIDCDGFKSINDKLGHAQGDSYLIEVCTLMKKKLADVGEIYRAGGDEFIWLVNINEQADNVEELTRVLKHLLENVDEAIKQSKWNSAGLSYGLATSIESNSLSDCLTLADQRMYRLKHSKKC